MANPLIVASRLPGDAPLTSEAYPVADVVCEDADFGYWAGINEVWDSDHDLVNVEHDVEFSDLLVQELLSCPHHLCAYPYRVMPFGWPGKTWGASYGSLWVDEGQPYASFSSIGFVKMTAEARAGTTLKKTIWFNLEGAIHEALTLRQRLWHLHWPAVAHHHDYDTDPAVLEAGSLYNLVRKARDEGRLTVIGDPLTDECLEKLKENDPLIYDESLRRLAQALCGD